MTKMIDIVIPKNNEGEFIEIASKLGIKKLYFLYDFNYYDKNINQKKLSFENHENIEVEIGFIGSQKNLNKAQHQSKLIVAKSSDNDRFFIESKKIKLIYGFEESNKKDYLHQRASGLNHILCELANKHNVVIGFSYSTLFSKDSQKISLLMGRMMLNIKLCQKYKVKTVIGSFSEKPFEMRSPFDITSLFTIFGMDGRNIKDSILSDFY